MDIKIIEALSKSAESGVVIQILYNGGSQPGSQRRILPITVTSDELKARDLSTGIVKIFKLEKIQLVDNDSTSPIYDPTKVTVVEEDTRTIEQALRSQVAHLKELGWHVVLSRDSISLSGFFKNGKPKRGAEVSLSYCEYSSESYFDPDTGEMIESEKKSSRPFRVDAKRFPMARTFSRLSKAIELFMAEADAQAPHHYL